MSKYPEIKSVGTIAVIGTGTIGASWATYFLAQGYIVQAWDPGREWEKKVCRFIDESWSHMEALGLAKNASKSKIRFCTTIEDALDGAEFVQESAPEKINIKRDLFQRLANLVHDTLVISSSTSGLLMSEMQKNIATGSRFVVGHPFNPPHLIPLVEVVGGRNTDPGAVDWTIAFYNFIGKHAIKIKKEVPGHLANRLQAALWREAILAIKNDLASVEDVNAAVARGPGLRWALMGPHMIMHLAGGQGGIEQMLQHFAPGIEDWWQTMTENPILNSDLQKALVEGIKTEAGGRTIDTLEKERDARLIKLLDLLDDKK